MRLFDIAMMLALFGAVLGVLDGSGWFPGGEIPINQTGLTESEIGQMKSVGGSDAGDPGGMVASAWAGWNIVLIMITAMYRVLWIWDIIVDVFAAGLPAGSADTLAVMGVAGIIQIGIWMIYGVGLLQLIRKTPITYMQ
ncbi:hypothetical protein J7J13_03080 [bacterium]|nr:hypothetical protein [bacterium]